MSDKKSGQTVVRKPIVKVESTCMPEGELGLESKSKAKAAESPLQLDETDFKARTRTELYKDLAKGEKEKGEEDYYDFSSPLQRGIGLAIDAVFIFFLVKAVILVLSPIELKLTHYFLDKYKLQFLFGDKVLLKLITGVSLFVMLFMAVVIPAAFFNSSLGKKITKQRIRGDEKYTLSISQAFKRELIWKPISIACLVGFVLPFFDKKKKSLHDKFSGTFIIKD